MAEPPERLFRDDAGAALERAARLEQENQELRAELAELRGDVRPRNAREAATVRTSRPGAVRATLLVGVSVMLAGTMLMARAARPSRCRASAPLPRIAVTSPRVTPAPTLAVPAATTVVTSEDDCSVPYTYDEHRVKRYKMRCIHPERESR